MKRELSSIDFQIKNCAQKKLDKNLELFKPYGLRESDDGIEKNFKDAFESNPDLENRICCTKRYSLENYLYDPVLICSLFRQISD